MKKSNIKTMKKYLVSLALKVPCNFEIEVNAKSDKEALKKALGKWDNGYDENNITDLDWGGLELDIDTKIGLYDLGNGISVKEIKNKTKHWI